MTVLTESGRQEDPSRLPSMGGRSAGENQTQQAKVVVNMKVNRWIRLSAVLAALAFAVGALTACGSSNDSAKSDTGAGTTSTDTSSAPSGLDAAKAAVDAGYKGTEREPASGGPKAQKGKRVFVISCMQAAPGCSIPSNAVKDAGQKLDWTVTVVDGKGDPGAFNAGMRQAIAAKADGIVLVAIDCPAVKTTLALAKKSNIPVVSSYGFDCNDPKIGGSESLLTASVNYGTDTIGDYFRDWGRLQANYVIAKSEGKGKIMILGAPEYLLFKYKMEGFHETIEKNCPDCEIVAEQDVPVTGLSNGKAVQQTQTLLAKHPETTVLVPGYDAMSMTVANSPVVRRKIDGGMLLVGSEGYIPNMDLIRQGIQTASIAVPAEWLGWAGADALNRVLAGETEIPDQGLGFTVIDKDHNLPPKGKNWSPGIDFKAAFERNWSGQG